MSSLTEEIKDIIILKNIYPFFDKEELKKKNYSSYWFGQEEIFIERLETLEKENIIDMEGKKIYYKIYLLEDIKNTLFI
tara:strand:- start:742 stop:978 length:237 start_codon:yes stop_codon:yes gene_type:complete